MKRNELTEWAVKGIAAEIDGLEKTVNEGKRLLLQYERGEQPKTKKTPAEIRDIISDKRAEIERLAKMRFDLTWELEVGNNEGTN